MRLAVTCAALVACGGTEVQPREPAPSPSSKIAELRERLRSSSDDRDRLVRLGALAEAEWAEACGLPTDDLCVRLVPRAAAAPHTCDDHTHDRLVKPRDARTVDEVTELVGESHRLWDHGAILREVVEHDVATEPFYDNLAMAEAVAGALLLLGHVEVEALLALPRPSSLEALEPWRASLHQRATDAFDRYAMVAADPLLVRWAPAVVIEAMARMGTVWLWAAQELAGLELPERIADDPSLEQAFCDALHRETESFELGAAHAFSRCVQAADDTGVITGWVDRCTDELARLRPTP